VKKVVVGCLVLLVVVGVGAATATWYASRYVYQQVRTTYDQFAQFQKVPALEREVQNQEAFAAPASDELTESQVKRLVQVQSAVRARLGARFAELKEKYQALADKPEPTMVDLPQLVGAYRDLASTWMDAKRAQVDALNEASLSLEEYRWIRQRAYAALGLPVMDVDVAKLVESITSGRAIEDPAVVVGALAPSGPEANKTLIEPFKTALEENVALAMFGL
jgi:hypothetical protein